MNNTINIDGQILQTEQQKELYGYLVEYMLCLKNKATEDLHMKDILTAAEDNLNLDKKFISASAKDLFKAEQGKLDLNKRNDDAAAAEQCMEVYDAFDGKI